MIRIDYQDSRPIYEQIVDGYKRLILNGVLEPNEQLSSVRNLAMELSANPNTIQKAYTELERQGFIYPVKGRGYFVKESDTLRNERVYKIVEEVGTLLIEARELGKDPRCICDAAIRMTEKESKGGTEDDRN